MMNSKHSKKLEDLAEKIALEDFDKLNEQYTFSDTYKHKKKLFMNEIKMKGGQLQAKRKKNRILIAAACLMIALPTTAFGAVKAYDMMVHKQNYEVNVSVANDAPKKNDSWYKMELGYLPENMEAIDETEMKYSFKDNFAKGGFSFILWKLGNNSDFQTLFSKSYEEKEINGKKAVIVSRDTGDKRLGFDRQVFLLFEEEGIMLESYVGDDVSEEQMMNVMENISLEPTSQEYASAILDYDEVTLSKKANESIEVPVETPLRIDSTELFSVGQKVPVADESGGLEYVIEKVEVFDSIKDFKQENFNDFALGKLDANKAIDEKKRLVPYSRDVYKFGNGIDSIHELVESQLVSPKFVYLTATVKNTGEKATEETYMYHPLKVLKSENNEWYYSEAYDMAAQEYSIRTREVDYLEPHGDGKSYYNIGSIEPGQTMNINLGYFVDEDKLDSIFLDVSSQWIDIRQ
ncbi:anti-sigma factor [Bacillus sp. IITD106]|nr:anti-sigma factor [Bacillus sp. IITD106]